MSKKRPLSYSACTKYLQCPASFDFYYNKKIVPTKLGSPLLAGSAMDDALNALLLDQGDPIEVFKKTLDSEPLGTVLPHVQDYDAELISDEQSDILLKKVREFGWSGHDVDGLAVHLSERIKAGDTSLSEKQYKAADMLARASLLEKGKLALKAYEAEVLPCIQKVYDVQKPSGAGYLDALVEWKGVGKVIADHKWVTRFFKPDAASYSAQLTMYAANENVDNVAFVAIGKVIKKNRRKICLRCGKENKSSHHTCEKKVKGARCHGKFEETIDPNAEIQVVHGKVTETMKAVAKELQENVQKAIQAQLFHCNVDKCNSQFGKPCVYKDLKWHGKMDGLKIRSRRKK